MKRIFTALIMSLIFAGGCLQANSQEARTLKISGIVKNTAGDPLIGVVVQEKGTNNVLATDNKGAFTMYNVAPQGAELEFTYIGYKTVTIPIVNEKELVVVMEDATVGVDEVVVTGYAQQKRESVVGSISTVAPTQIRGTSSVRITSGLAGQMAGVIIQQNSGVPGSGANFWIRGVSSFGSSTAPLVLIDGVERDINTVTTDEIESISVLKDAAASAVYGMRGANGVLLITTKRGNVGKPVVTARYEHMFNTPTQMPEFVDGAKYMEITNAAYLLSGRSTPYFSQEQIDKTRSGEDPDLYPSTNWLEECFRDWGNSDRASIDINGGTDLIRYSLVAAIFNERGLNQWDETRPWNSKQRLNQINVRSTVDINVTNSTLVTFSIGSRIEDMNEPFRPQNEAFWAAFTESPICHPKILSNGEIPIVRSRRNPWAWMTQTGTRQIYNTILNSLISVEQDWGKVWKPLNGLKLSASFSYDAYLWNNRFREFIPKYVSAIGRDTETGELITEIVDPGQEFMNSWTDAGGNRGKYGEWKLSYDRKFGKHSMGLMMTGNLRDYVNGNDLGNDLQEIMPRRNMGLAGRAMYSYDDRYFFEFNFGYNGTDNFAPGLRYGFFPAVAGGWMVSNEKFMEGARDVIHKLKLRASWGQVGTSASGNRRWPYIGTIASVSGYSYGYNSSLGRGGRREGEFGITDLTWETTTKLNLGVELGLFNVLDLTVDVFKERREDILMQRKIFTEITGFTSAPWANYGIMENRGIELTLNYNHKINEDLFIGFRGTFSYIKNKVIEYDEPNGIIGTDRSLVGKSSFVDLMLKAEGLYTDEDFANKWTGELKEGIPQPSYGTVKPGDIKYADLNNDGVITDADKGYFGNPFRFGAINYGFGATINWKWLDFGFFFQGVGKTDFMLGVGGTNAFIPGEGSGALGNYYTNCDDRWTPEIPSQDAFWPRLSYGFSGNNHRYSTWWTKNGSFLRLKNVELGFTLPKKWQNAARMRNARLYVRGTNLLTFSEFDLWDPEMISGNGMAYPPIKSIAVGLEVSF